MSIFFQPQPSNLVEYQNIPINVHQAFFFSKNITSAFVDNGNMKYQHKVKCFSIIINFYNDEVTWYYNTEEERDKDYERLINYE